MIALKIDGREYKVVTTEDLRELKRLLQKLLKMLKEEKSYPEDLFDRFLKEVERW